jgi:hypothetical protein
MVAAVLIQNGSSSNVGGRVNTSGASDEISELGVLHG